ncbi:MAG: sensor histidine kinase [bacterium]|nr:sensor histidine kinase [bacterium]
MNVLLPFLTVFFLFTEPALGAVQISGPQTRLMNGLEYRFEQGKRLSFEEVRALPFTKHTPQSHTDVWSLGFDSPALWIRLKLDLAPGLTRDWVLEQKLWLVQQLDLYQPTPSGVVHLEGGNQLPPERVTLHTASQALPLTLEPGLSHEIYLRFETWQLMEVSLVLWEAQAYANYNQARLLRWGLLLGGFVLLFLFVGMMALLLREKTLYYYLFYLSGITLFITNYNGLGRLYLWPHWPQFTAVSTLVISIYALLGILVFGGEFIGLNRHIPQVRWVQRFWYLVLTGLSLFSGFLGFGQAMTATSMVGILVSLWMFGLAVYLAKRGIREAKIYTIAWSPLMVSILLLACRVWLPDLEIYEASDALQWASLIEMSLFGLAIASRILQLSHQLLEQTSQYASQLEVQVNERTAQLNEANQSKNKFFSLISHDLRGPINNLSTLFNEHLQKASELDDRLFLMTRNYLSNLSRLIENLLTWAASQSERMAPAPVEFDFNLIFNEVRRVLEPVAQAKQIELVYQLPEKLPVWADPSMANTVLRNLVSNAIKYTPKGGQITLSAEIQGPVMKCWVADKGLGMDPQVQAKLFKVEAKMSSQPGTEEEPGTGMGLILVKEFIDKNHGSLGVKSQLGEGSQFWFTLPSRPPQETS